jgi:ubiquinol-cytochrome c reductase iron-sulfur subunit
MRLVREDGSPIRPEELTTDGLLTVWPDGHTDAADAPTLLISVDQEQADRFRSRPGREGWTVGSIVAYSKLCTHAGCPVGLYQAEIGKLLCPCHQSTFDVLDGARPVFGPAARSLPQLPLDVDDEGYLIATGDFSGPTGPGFWDRDR